MEQTPRDRFALWLKDLGTGNAAKLIGVTEHQIRQWRSRESSPRPAKALKCIQISHGLLDWECIYLPYAIKQSKKK